MKNLLRKLVLTAAFAATAVTMVQASTDYGPAVWRPVCDGKWYTSGFGKKFYVIHDMEGYYLTGMAYIQRCDISVSIHYCINGKVDTASDAAPGEVSQMVRDTYYAWHARCWNQHTMGTEHEGFASNPAWFTTQMYDASALLTRSKADKYGMPKNRNHICGHNQKSVSGWPAYASANLGVDPYCNDHTDPGPYWDWSGFMSKINGGASKTPVVKDNPSAVFTGTWATGTAAGDKHGTDYRFHSTAPVSEPATWTTALNTSATWTVRAWWPAGSNRSATAPYIVTHAGGTATVNKNQQVNGGSWQTLGSWSMSSGNVKLSCWTTTGYVVMADAIRWE